MILTITGALGLVALILNKLKYLLPKEIPQVLIVIMMAFDFAILWMLQDYATKKEMAIGIIFATLLKTIIFLYDNTKRKTN